MPTLNIGDQSVQVDDNFLKLSPDQQNATVDEIAKSLGGSTPTAAPQTPAPTIGTMADIAKSTPNALASMVAGVAGLPADLASLGAHGLDYMAGTKTAQTIDPYAQKIGSENIKKKIEGYTGELYKPQTTGGQYFNTGVQFLPAMLGGPETLLAKLATRVAAPAIASETAGQLAQGTPFETPARIGGALLGAGAPVALSRAISPATIDAANAGAIKTLTNAGVDLTAGQKSGSRSLKYMESELGDSLGAGSGATAANQKALEQFTAAAAKPAGIEATRVTPDVLDNAFTTIGAKFDNTAKAAGEIPLPGIQQKTDKIIQDFKLLTNTKEDPQILQDFAARIAATPEQQTISAAKPGMATEHISVADFRKLQSGATNAVPKLTGEQYQSIQSDILKAQRQTTVPAIKLALGDMKQSLDNAIQKGLKDPKLADQWREARTQYKNLLIVEKALARGGEAANAGLITPAALRQAAQTVEKRGFGRGKSAYTDLAKAGSAVMAPLPQSGTAPRAAMHVVPSLLGAGAGALAGGGFGAIGPILGGLVAPAIAGRAIMSRPIQAYLSNQLGVPLRNIPVGRNALKGGLLALQAQHQ